MADKNFFQRIGGLISFKKKPLRDISTPKNEFTGYTGGQYRPLFAYSFNGEKNLGEIGPIKSYVMDYEALRLRSWQSYIDSELTKTVVNKILSWTIGKGLKLQLDPNVEVLKDEGINLDAEKFSQIVENRFSVFADSRNSDYAGMRNLNYLERKVLLNAIIGGDVLVLLRYEDGCVNIQLVDATHIISPRYGNEWYPQYLPNGNRIVNGIELDEKNRHIAYYVRKPGLVFEVTRVPAMSETGLVTAFLVYGDEYRIDNMRGIPLVATVLETLKKLERYKEATIGSAEERAKIVYQIVHLKEFSTGESPLKKELARAYDYDQPINDMLPMTIEGQQLANRVAASTNKSTYNMPIGSEMRALEAKNELYFKDFYDKNIDVVCACLDIPPEVAMSKYDSNYSASRAALKEWENKLHEKRHDFGQQFLSRVLDFWFYVEVMKGNVNAPGYLTAFMKNDYMVKGAYLKSRWIGVPVPHIDPLKEVQAERLKLGTLGEALPLTTVEQAVEALNGGNAKSNIEQFAREKEEAESLGLKEEIENPNPAEAPKPEKNKKKQTA